MRKKYFYGIMTMFMLVLLFVTVYGYFDSQNTCSEISFNTFQDIDTHSNSDEVVLSKVEQLQQEYHNLDIKAVLSIDNSDFSEIVVQSLDNDYYLTHNYAKEQAPLGAIFADYRVQLESEKKVLIYGHSSTKGDAPFNYLEEYYDPDFYENHKYITLETKDNTYQYEIFSVYVETSDFTYMNLFFDNQDDWYSHILKLQSKSLYAIDTNLTAEDDILILQTCSNHSKYKDYSKKYLLIVSKKVKL